MSRGANPHFVFGRLLTEANRLKAWMDRNGSQEQQETSTKLVKALLNVQSILSQGKPATYSLPDISAQNPKYWVDRRSRMLLENVGRWNAAVKQDRDMSEGNIQFSDEICTMIRQNIRRYLIADEDPTIPSRPREQWSNRGKRILTPREPSANSGE